MRPLPYVMELDLKSRTPVAAQARAEAIRLNVQQAALVYARAVELEDWRTLNCRDLSTWARNEFGADRFSPERRKEIHALLADKGLTQRQIAAATGVNQSTVARDQAAGDANASQGTTRPNTTKTPRQRAARQREERRRTSPPAPAPAPAPREETPKEEPQMSQLDAEVLRRVRAHKPVPRKELGERFGVGAHAVELSHHRALGRVQAEGEPASRGRAKNWNGKTNPGRERELKTRKKSEAEAYLALTKMVQIIAQLSGVLEGVHMDEFTPEEVTLWYISDMLDDLISLGTWLDRTIPAVQRWLGDADVRAKIEQLRNVTGRSPEETKAFLARAAKLERQLNNVLEKAE